MLQGEGVERLLVKGKKGQVEEVDGDPYRYFLLAGTSHPYPDDTFYSVGRVPRKLLMKYLGVKMYLIRLKVSPMKVTDLTEMTEQLLETTMLMEDSTNHILTLDLHSAQFQHISV